MPIDMPITVIGTVYAKNGQLFLEKGDSQLIVSTIDYDELSGNLKENHNASFWISIVCIVIGGIPLLLLILAWIIEVIEKIRKKFKK